MNSIATSAAMPKSNSPTGNATSQSNGSIHEKGARSQHWSENIANRHNLAYSSVHYVAGSTHQNGLFEVRAHELLVAQEQEARGTQNRAQEILQMVQGSDPAQRGSKVRYTARVGPIFQWQN